MNTHHRNKGGRKKHAEEMHSLRRASERYGLSLCLDDIRHIAKRIRRGEGRFLLRQSLSRSLWEIDVCGTDVVLVYDNSRGTIRTFLPPRQQNSIEQYIETLQQYFYF